MSKIVLGINIDVIIRPGVINLFKWLDTNQDIFQIIFYTRNKFQGRLLREYMLLFHKFIWCFEMTKIMYLNSTDVVQCIIKQYQSNLHSILLIDYIIDSRTNVGMLHVPIKKNNNETYLTEILYILKIIREIYSTWSDFGEYLSIAEMIIPAQSYCLAVPSDEASVQQ